MRFPPQSADIRVSALPAALTTFFHSRLAVPLVVLAVSYYLAARLGMALQSPAVPQSILWFPNALLLGTLLIVPTSRWWMFLLAAAPAQAAVGWQSNTPVLPFALLYVTNCMDAGLGAYFVRRAIGNRPLSLSKLKHMVMFLGIAATTVTLLVSFLDAAVTTFSGWNDNYWLAWSTRARSNLVTNVVLVPTLLGFYDILRNRERWLNTHNVTNAGLLLAATLGMAFLTFSQYAASMSPGVLYVTLPLLVLGAIRYGVGVPGLQLLLFAIVASWSVARGPSLFETTPGKIDVLAVQFFLFVTSVPILCLASVVAERGNMVSALRASERRARRQLARLITIYRSTPVGLAFVDPQLRVTSANQHLLWLGGATAAVNGRGLEDFLPDLAPQLAPLIRNVISTGTPVVDRSLLLNGTGATSDNSYLVSCDPVRDTDGGLLGVNVVISDVSEQKRVERDLIESRRRLHDSYIRRQELAGRLIRAQEVERNRIAVELHDDFGQQLAELSIALGNLRNEFGPADLHVRTELNQVRHRIAELAHSMRDLSHDLHPAVLRHAGLSLALQSRCADLSRHHDVQVVCNTDPLGEIPDDVALCLYRVAQEGLNNVIRHANAKRVEVTLKRTSNSVQLTVADDGRGFNTTGAFRNVGLYSVVERARLVAGKVKIESAPGGGTTLKVDVPVGSPLDNPKV